jgi:hypothetical protein
MLKVELETNRRFYSVNGGTTLAESRSLVSRKARSTLAQTDGMCGTRHRSSMTNGSAMGLEMVWVRDP